jgi:hypothetical protein
MDRTRRDPVRRRRTGAGRRWRWSRRRLRRPGRSGGSSDVGLENFDAIGRWRDRDDAGGAIDAAGELPGGKHFTSPKELKTIIAARKNDLARNVTEKLLGYALCRQLEGYDEIVVDHLMETISRDGYRMQTLIIEIVTSYPFTHRRIQESDEKLASNEK